MLPCTAVLDTKAVAMFARTQVIIPEFFCCKRPSVCMYLLMCASWTDLLEGCQCVPHKYIVRKVFLLDFAVT